MYIEGITVKDVEMEAMAENEKANALEILKEIIHTLEVVKLPSYR